MQVLRPPQIQVVNEIRAAYKAGHRRVLLVAGTGFGKTTCCSHIIHGLIKKSNHAIFLAHRIELLDQCSQRLREHGVPHGILKSGRHLNTTWPVYVASVPTLVNRFKHANPELLTWQPEADLIVIDEAHRASAPSYRKIIERYPNALVLGLTATPQRTNGEGLGDMFDVIVQSPSVAELIQLGWLSPYILFESPMKMDFSGVEIKRGEMDEKAVAAMVDKPDLIGDVFRNWKLHADGQRTIIFAVSRLHAQHILEQFKSRGENFEYVDGDTDAEIRKNITTRFSRGDILGVVNVGIFSEGYDVPDVSCIVMARPTASLILWLQCCGRGLRPAPGKTFCTYLDHGSNAMRLGLPDDPREWSLLGRKKNKPVIPSLRTCNVCFAVLRSGVRTCPSCGDTLPMVSGTTELPTIQDAVLVERVPKTRAQLKFEKEQQLEFEKTFLADHVRKQEKVRYTSDGSQNPKYDPKAALKAFRYRFGEWPAKKHGVEKEWQNVLNRKTMEWKKELVSWKYGETVFECPKPAPMPDDMPEAP